MNTTTHESVSGRRYIAIYRDVGWHVCDTETQRVSRETTPDLSICLLACEHHEAGNHHVAADLMRPVRPRMEVIEDPLRIRQIFEDDQRAEDERAIRKPEPQKLAEQFPPTGSGIHHARPSQWRKPA